MRKTDGTLEEQRAKIRSTYKRGRIQGAVVTGDQSLSEVERQIKQEICCYLKAQDFSYGYMADALGVSSGTVKKWFANEEWMRLRLVEIRNDLVGGAVKYLKTYAIEVIETLMQVMRQTEDEQLAVKIGFEILDRLGISKVNKSESVSAQTLRNESEVDITDKTGLLRLAANAPAHVQAQMAKSMESVIALAEEYGGIDALVQVVEDDDA